MKIRGGTSEFAQLAHLESSVHGLTEGTPQGISTFAFIVILADPDRGPICWCP